jgi:hypothetical protein
MIVPAVAFLCALLPFAGHAQDVSHVAATYKKTPSSLRKMESSKSGSDSGSDSGDGDGGDGNGDRVQETTDCIPFDDPAVQVGRGISLSVLDLTAEGDACKTNSCSGGCCRIYNFLECDEDNMYPHLKVSSNQRTGIAGTDLLEKRAGYYALT